MKVPKRPGMPGKLQARWAGPFIVITCMQGNTYRIKKADNFRLRFIRHFDQLKPVEQREKKLQTQIKEEDRQTGPGPSEQRQRVGMEEGGGTPRGRPTEQISLDSETSDEDDVESEEEQEQDENNQQEQEQGTDPQAQPRRGEREKQPPDRYGEWTV